MTILKKLVCKKVKGDSPLELDDTWTATSSAVEAEFLRYTSSVETIPDDVYTVMEKKLREMDIPTQWIMDCNNFGLLENGVAISADDASDQYIVEEVRKSLKPSKKVRRESKTRSCAPLRLPPERRNSYLSRREKQRSKVSKSPSSQEDSKRDEPDLADQVEDQLVNRMERDILMDELESVIAEQVEALVKPKSPKSLLRAKSLNTTAKGKKARFAPHLEEQFTVPPEMCQFTVPSRANQEVIKSSSSPRYCYIRSPFFDSDANSIAEVSVDRSCGDNSSAFSSHNDDQSIETMELCFNHLTCSEQDRLIGSDWIR